MKAQVSQITLNHGSATFFDILGLHTIVGSRVVFCDFRKARVMLTFNPGGAGACPIRRFCDLQISL